MSPLSSGPSGDAASRERRRYLFDMMEQLAAMAVSCREKEVADVLYALVAVYGESTCAVVETRDHGTALD